MIESLGKSVLDVIRLITELGTFLSLLGGLFLFRQKLVGDQIAALEERFARLAARRQAIIENPKALEVEAQERKITQKQYLINHETLNGITAAYILFLRKRKWVALSQAQWKRDLLEIREYFELETVQARWQEISHKYELPFQDFIQKRIISTKTD